MWDELDLLNHVTVLTKSSHVRQAIHEDNRLCRVEYFVPARTSY